MKKIIHTHPSANAAKIFVAPLIEMEQSFGYSSDMCTDVELSNLCVFPFPGSIRLGRYLFVANVVAFGVLLRRFRRNRYDLLFCHNTLAAALPLMAGLVCKIPRRIYFNHGVPYRGYRGCRRLALKALENFNCFLATEIVCVNPKDATDAFAGLLQKKNIFVLNSGSACGIDLQLYETKRPLELKKANPVVVYAGRANKRKGFDVLLHVAKILRNSSSVSFIVCGVDRVEAQKYSAKLPTNISFLGWVEPDRWRRILMDGDVLLAPSLHEGFPYAVLEGWASGIPILARRSPGHVEMVRDGETGILYEDCSPANLAVLLLQLLDNEMLRQSLSNAGRLEAARYCRHAFKRSYEQFVST